MQLFSQYDECLYYFLGVENMLRMSKTVDQSVAHLYFPMSRRHTSPMEKPPMLYVCTSKTEPRSTLRQFPS